MQTVETAEGWAGVLADLGAKRLAAQAHAEQLRAQKRSLALEAAMGGADAQKKLAKVNVELARMALEGDDWDAAIQRAESQKQQAAQAAADAAERRRHEEIGANLGQYLSLVREVDDAMRLLTVKFSAARQSLDAAEALMNGAERAPLQQLRSLWGATMAAAHHGLAEHLRLAPDAGAYPQHRQPLAEHVSPFVAPWIEPASGDGKE